MTWDDEDFREESVAADGEFAVPEPAELKPQRWNRGVSGKFARRVAGRITTEQLLSRASILPEAARGLLNAYFEHHMPAEELAALHKVTVGQLRRRLDHWRETLADPAFLLFSEFGNRLPRNLAEVARRYWIEGLTLREIAAGNAITLHRVRAQLALARSLLVVAMSRRQEVPGDLAKVLLEGRM